MAADASQYPRRDTLSIEQGRANAEKVRLPWAQGGPAMARTDERQVTTRHGQVRVRVYYPAQRRLPGAFMYIHGGGFVLFSIDTHGNNESKRVQRGGSFLCSDLYCSRYRAGGRQQGEPKTGQSHSGFRCVKPAK